MAESTPLLDHARKRKHHAWLPARIQHRHRAYRMRRLFPHSDLLDISQLHSALSELPPPAEDPNPTFLPASLQPIYGPFLRYHDVLPPNSSAPVPSWVWKGSVLVVVHRSVERNPQLAVAIPSIPDERQLLDPIVVVGDAPVGFRVLRYDIEIPLTSESQTIRYGIDFSEQGTASFVVPAESQSWRWMFYSCNGLSVDVKDPQKNWGGVTPLWKDVLAAHKQEPLHCMVGIGDQIYQDDFFHSLPSFIEWLALEDSEDLLSHPFTPAMETELAQFFLVHYLIHFSQPVVGEAMRSIPSLMMVDDHDLFDGYGSYPAYLQNCPVFQGIGRIARDYYFIFQHHTTYGQSLHYGLYSAGRGEGRSFLRLLGPRTAISGVDSRFERTENQVANRETWDYTFDKVLPTLPSSVVHLVFIAGVPFSYPALTLVERALKWVAWLRNFSFFHVLLKKTGLFENSLGFMFFQPQILDDLVDHWSSHLGERDYVLERLRRYSQQTSARVTVISGDIHCAAVSKIESDSQPSAPSDRGRPSQDHRLIFNVISSGIANVPPPKFVQRLFAWSDTRRQVDEHSTEQLIPLFEHDVNGSRLAERNRKVMGRRNWCLVEEQSPSSDPDASLARFTFHVEKKRGGGKGSAEEAEQLGVSTVVTYSLDVPKLSIRRLDQDVRLGDVYTPTHETPALSLDSTREADALDQSLPPITHTQLRHHGDEIVVLTQAVGSL
ncbi:uncharacterized protein BJ171DRAFT_517207 [Polychytrium aggregatum]|uniref:uncharacterized protein n=1 Tax=Polychytrium aggregatum TaxID=110093 RepID=UPI0022FDFE77|nr:uncharacterized protein BJ171DRAFT_517207 [Polychytrium aggregatum]KAI9199860.1 hypothetical protein BJ171DRAFT_517207 [Polychytrium aggregatum]